MNIPKVTRVVVLFHAGQLRVGRFVPIANTDLDVELDEWKDMHLKAGAKMLYDGPSPKV